MNRLVLTTPTEFLLLLWPERKACGKITSDLDYYLPVEVKITPDSKRANEPF